MGDVISMEQKEILFSGNLIIVGFGSIGQGVLPLILRHLDIRPEQITILTGDSRGESVAKEYGVSFNVTPLTRENYKDILGRLLKGGDFLLNLSVDVSSCDLIDLCAQNDVLYLDTCIEPWSGGYDDQNVSLDRRTNYALREEAMLVKEKNGAHSATAVITHGVNPGLVSCFVKDALVQIAHDTGVHIPIPASRKEWATLAQMLDIKTIHIAEHDTQVCHPPKQSGEFVNTWSVDGFISESVMQPAELGWGSHEKYFPADGNKYIFGCRAAIYLNNAGSLTRVYTWTPLIGHQIGLLVTHNESISIADYLTIGNKENPEYRPTVYYAYNPCEDAQRSLQELDVRNGKQHEKQRVVVHEITEGTDELGVLLMGHKKGAYWYGSRLSVDQARALAPHNSATSLQVAAGVLAGMVWAMKNPKCGVVEPDDIPYEEILRVAKPYLGVMVGEYSNWTPLREHSDYFKKDIDETDPWQFKNFRVS